jgi:hypothetical protein
MAAESFIASVPGIVPWGRGLLVAFMLSAAGAALMFRARPKLASGERGVTPQE